jgi:DNA-binding MarR family transcriptional regulator
VAETSRRHGDGLVIIVPKKDISQDLLRDSLLAHVAAAYFSVGKRLERKTRCSATRGFILSTLRGGTALNQNQIATHLGFDRTVVHRAVKSMVQEGLVAERKAKSGRAIHVRLTPKGHRYRKRLINARIAADHRLRTELTPEESTTLLRLLKLIAELEF